MKMLIMGAPGSGKGTQSERIAEKLNIPTISTGTMLRTAIAEKTTIGDIAAQYINDGNFVPDNVIIDLVLERVAKEDCKNGYILDGFPRNVPQAIAMKEAGIKIDKVLEIVVDDEEIVNRLVGRRVCQKCGATYHVVYHQPKVEGVCDVCGGEIITRADDKEEIIRERLEIYHKQTAPVLELFKDILVSVDSQKGIDDTTKMVFEAIK